MKIYAIIQMLLLAAWWAGPGLVRAAEAQFTLGGATLTLEDVTGEVEARFHSVRLNRAQNLWNLEVLLTNRSSRVVEGPFVLVLDAQGGSSQPISPDGLDSSAPARPFFDLSAQVGSGKLAAGAASDGRTLAFTRGSGLPLVATRVFAAPKSSGAAGGLGIVRTLTEVGQPFPGVQIEEAGANGTTNLQTDPFAGVATLGQIPGASRWRFSAPSYLPVWRSQTLRTGEVAVIPSPRLTARSLHSLKITPSAGGLLHGNSLDVVAGAGAVSGDTTAVLTELTPQTLPAPLPAGWSPLQAFWLEFSVEPARPLTASMNPGAPLRTGESAALVKWNETKLLWEVTRVSPGKGTNVLSLPIASSGAYVLAVADLGAAAPPLAVAGQPLPATTVGAGDGASWTAAGAVDPATSVASRAPELVTALARVNVTNSAGPAPSGLLLQCELTETYRLNDSSARHPPLYETFISAFQRPDGSAPGGLQAIFPLRPVFLFGPEELTEGVIKVDVLAPAAFTGAVFDPKGGQVSAGDLRILAGAGAVSSRQAAVLRRLDPANFQDLISSNLAAAAAFELTVAGVGADQHLVVQAGRLAAKASFVLARVIYDLGWSGLQPIERLVTDDAGRLNSTEPRTGDRLSGLRAAGQYLLVQTAGRESLILGTARDSSGRAAGGLPVRVKGEPWLAISAADGSFGLLARQGDVTLSVTDPRTSDTGEAALTVADAQPATRADVAPVPIGPSIVSLNPTNNAVNVPRITSITVGFSKPINPGSLGTAGIQLLDTNSQPVTATLTLNLRNTEASLLPINPLNAGTKYTLQVARTISDGKGLPLAGDNVFRFTTLADAARADSAQLTIFQPGAQNLKAGSIDVRPLLVGFEAADRTNVVVAYGSPGTAEPEVAVILVNETTGETATVLSKVDGSFAGFVRGGEEDLVSAVFLNRNNTSTRVPVSRQQFDDGRVGLYNGGGILEAQSDGGAVQVIVSPNAISQRSVFKVEMTSLADLLAATKGTVPQGAKLLQAFHFKAEGDVPTSGVDLSFPVDPATLGLPQGENPEEASLGALAPQNVEGVVAYQLVDKLRYKDGKAFSNTAPFAGLAGMLLQGVLDFNVTLALFGGKPVVVSGRAVEAKKPVADLAKNLPTTPEIINAMLAGGFIGNFPGVAGRVDKILSDPNSLIFKPVAGAFVFAKPVGEGGAGGRVPGRIEAGAVYATSDQHGVYALALPVKVGEAAVPFTSVPGYSLVAIHPRYHQVLVGGLSFTEIGVDVGELPFFARNLIFSGPLANGSPLPALKVEASVQPASPALGQPAQIRAVAYSGNGEANFKQPVKDAVASSVAGQQINDSDITIDNFKQLYLGNGVTEMTATVTGQKSAQALLRLEATQTVTGGTISDNAVLFVRFGQGEPSIPDALPPADPTNRVGPCVLRANLADGGPVPASGRIILQFSEPLNRRSIERSGAIVFQPNPIAPPSFSLSADQQTLEIFPGLYPDSSPVKLTLTSAITDLNGNHFDQSVFDRGDQSYSLNFQPPVSRTLSLSGMQNGGGVVVSRDFIYALERGGSPGIAIYKIDDVLAGQGRAGFVPLIGEPRDLVLIQNWPHKRSLHDTTVHTNDLLAVVGGDAGTKTVDSDRNITFAGQFLRVFDLSSPTSPERVVGALLTLRDTIVSRVVWSPPYLGYVESGSDLQASALVNLQAMMVGFNGTPAETGAFPAAGFAGLDLDQNGSFVQLNELLPNPEHDPLEFFGKEATFTLSEPGLIQDLALDFGFAAEVTTGGIDPLHPGRAPTAPAYRTLRVNGKSLPEEVGILGFDVGSRPKRLFVLLGQTVEINRQPQKRSLALVTMAPDADKKGKVVLVDLANPADPQISQEGDPIEIPDALGLPQSITRRSDGLLALATATHLILLDPAHLLATGPGGPGTAGQSTRMHPAVVGIIPQGGSGNRTLDSEPIGVSLVNLGARSVLVQTAPRLSFVIFPSASTLVDPKALVGSDPQLNAAFNSLRPLSGIPLARLNAKGGAVSSVEQKLPIVHSHVLVECPGGSGAELTIALESLNDGGFALKDKGLSFPPVRAVDPATLQALKQDSGSTGGKDQNGADFRPPVSKLTAFRLSSDPASKFYNLYLSQPFAVIRESATAAQLKTLAKDRPILWSGHSLRASLDNIMSANPAIGLFADTVDPVAKLILPVASVVAECLPGSYIPGNNPPPPGAELSFPGTFRLVNALNGEMRTTEVDLQLPSRRMPIAFVRTLAGQDLHHGPFGPGWDFNYNQRLVQFKPSLFPAGSQAPVVVRNTVDRSTIAESGDVQLIDGEGHVILFKSKGSAAPDGIANDPLAKQLGWFDAGGDFYVPDPNTKGVFDILYRFPSGEFCRLTPGGSQYWYAADGRLLRIKDKYDQNIHALDYNTRGELIRINDLSVNTDPPRALEIGYYRLAGDTHSDLDQVTDSAFVAGQICALRDFAKRVTKYKYFPTGLLQQVQHPETDSTASSSAGKVGFQGNPTTVYLMDSAGQSGFRGVVEGNGTGAGGGNSGSALFTANLNTSGGKPVVISGTGAGGAVGVTVDPSNSAEAGATPAGANQGTRADQGRTSFSFDEHGRVSGVSQTGHDADEAASGITYTPEGLIKTVAGPEGDVTTYDYFPNSLIRARANLRKITRSPGSRGGPVITSSFGSYEQRYNIPQGAAKNANGKTITYTVTSDNRDLASIDYGGGATSGWTYNEYGQVLTASTPDGIAQSWSYDSTSGYPLSEAVGPLVTRFGYDGTIAGQLGTATTITLPRGSPVEMSYDSRLLVLGARRDGQQTTHAYDENGNEVYEGIRVDSGVTREVSRQFNQNNFLTSTKYLAVEPGPGQGGIALETTYVPDEVFRTKEIHLPAGEVQQIKYDHLGRRIAVSVNGRTTDYSYDRNGNLRKSKVSTDATFGVGPIIQEITYDGHDRPVQVIRPGSKGDETTIYSYFDGGELRTRAASAASGGGVEDFSVVDVDGFGRPLQILRKGTSANATINYTYRTGQSGLTVTINGPNDIVTVATDAAGRLAQKKDSLATRTFTVNESFLLEKISSAEDGTVFEQGATYDQLDRVTGLSDSLGAKLTPAPRLDGLPSSSTDALGNVTHFAYSALGELLRVEKPESLRTDYHMDGNRRPAAILDRGGRGHAYEYGDKRLRMTKLTLRDGSAIEFRDPNVFNLPATVSFPGSGSESVFYDGQGRVTKDETRFNGVAYLVENVAYDAAGREVSIDYTTHSARSTAAYTYDKLGPLTKAVYNEPGGPYTIEATIREDGARTSVTYPSGVKLNEVRENSGRLKSVSINGEASPLWTATLFAGASEPVRITRGPITETRSYDLRKRLVDSKVVRTADGALLSEWRFLWDGANNLLARQAIHEQGRADLFSYDGANRLKRVHYGARPAIPGETAVPISGLNPEQGLRPGYAARFFVYDSGGLDLLSGSTLVDALEPKPVSFAPFPGTIGGHDAFLFAESINGVSRGAPDALGNALQVRHLMLDGNGRFVEQAANLVHSGRGDLVKASRNGSDFTFHYRPDHLLHRKESKSGGAVLGDRALVWDGERLIEEYDITGAARLLARYYYAEGDTPMAADFADSSNVLRRHYFVHDNVDSVTAVVDGNGRVVERMHYDPWGFSLVEFGDAASPQIAQIVEEQTGSFLLIFSEPVLPPVNASGLPPITSGGTVLAASAGPLSQLIVVRQGGTTVNGDVGYVESASGVPFGTVVRFTPSGRVSGSVGIELAAGKLFDSWGNGNAAQSLIVSLAGSAGVRLASGVTNTGPSLQPTSPVGNPFRFQGQYAELDLGLIYMRGRFYNPLTGSFIEPDPFAYQDSVNPYCGLGNAPASARDPMGTANITARGGAILLEEFILKGGRQGSRMAAKEVETSAAELLAGLERRRAAKAMEVTGVVEVEALERTATAAGRPVGGLRRAAPTRAELRKLRTRGEGVIEKLTTWGSEAAEKGKLEIRYGELPSGQWGEHFFDPETDKSIITLSTRFLDDSSRALEEKLTLFHELSHAFSRRSMGSARLGVEVQSVADRELFEGLAGFRVLQEEFGAFSDEVAIELAIRGSTLTTTSPMLSDYLRYGPSIILDHLESKYASSIQHPWHIWKKRNPWWFEK